MCDIIERTNLGQLWRDIELKIRDIELYNFRNFRKKKISFANRTSGFAKSFVVLIGDNGAGKTSILEAITKCFVPLIRGVNKEAVTGCDLTNNDIRYQCAWTGVSAHIELRGTIHTISNKRRISKDIKEESKEYASFFEHSGNKERLLYVKEQLMEEAKEKSLPIILYYGTNRVFNEVPKRGHIREYNINDALKSCFDNSNNFREFYEWFKTEEDIELREKRDGTNYKNCALDAVRSAISNMILGYSDLRIKLNPSRMVITNSKREELRIEQLSDGYKAVLAVVSDIAKRLAMANPELENPLHGEAIILIDEIDLHLHPKWQKTIVSDLKRTFPNCQFIVTTHSPFIIQSLRKDELINLESDELGGNSNGSFEGWSIEEIQEHEMKVDIRTDKYNTLIDNFTKAVDNENIEEVEKLYNELSMMLRKDSVEKKIIDMDMRMVGKDD